MEKNFKNLNVELDWTIKGMCEAVVGLGSMINIKVNTDCIGVVRSGRTLGFTDRQLESIRRGLLSVLHCCFDIEKTDYGFNITFAE